MTREKFLDTAAFEAGLQADVFAPGGTNSKDAGLFVDTHSHPFDVRALVLQGQVTITCGDQARTYQAGDVLELARNIAHSEQFGPEGYTFLLGRRS